MQPGDLIFSRTPIGHVAIYIGNGKMVHAPRRGDVVKVGAVPWERVVG
ncbi:MAG: NlpC/P60 family protein, partial [Burkholderiaceae bacterium]|nr:NlpC/P60 family protein [Burkholderiaceae bacterium]